MYCLPLYMYVIGTPVGGPGWVGTQRLHPPLRDLTQRGVASGEQRANRRGHRCGGDFDDEPPWTCVH